MATNLALSDDLIQEAVEVGQHKTKKEAVTAALQEYIKMHRRLRIFDLVGKVDYYEGHDPKALRRAKKQ